MKYCLSARQTKEILKQADEILVEAKDYRVIPDYFYNYPDTIIILDLPKEQNEVSKDTLLTYSKASNNFIVRLNNLDDLKWYKENGIKFYYRYPVSTFYDVQGLIYLGAEYIAIMAPLTFQMDKLKTLNVKFRMVPNVAYDAYIPRKNGIHGQWVRPEDLEYYENIAVFEFEDADLQKEKTLFDIYKNKKKWNGNLNLLITNLNHNVDNRSILPETGKMRSNCGQRCQTSGNCHFCDLSLTFNSKVFKWYTETYDQN